MIEEKPPLTANKLAADYFRKELLNHENLSAGHTDTLVLTHDSCYGHRYSRPRTSKATLSLIMERPERLQAGLLGVSLAYTRVGQRHADGAHEPGPDREPCSDIPFRIWKTTRTVSITSPIMAAVHGAKWTQEIKAMCLAAEAKLAAGGRELARPETPTSVNGSPKAPLHEGDLYLCKESLDAFEGALGGVCDAVDTVFDDNGEGRGYKKAFVCIRPPGHHCSSDWPSGFCWINNVHVGIEHAIQTHGLTHAAILDFDLHHGDGSQAIAWERNARSVKAQKSTAKNAAFKKSSVGYFSIHDINSYPCEDGDFNKVQRASVCIENAHGQNIWNIHLQPWAQEEDFWDLYEKQYVLLIDKARAYLRSTTQRLLSTNPTVKPRGAIFLSAGFDASEWETPSMQRHKVNVPTEFYARFTSDVVKLAQEECTAVDGRVISVLEGGYSDRAITSGVFSHIAGLSSSTEPSQTSAEGVTPPPRDRGWDPSWWSAASLQELENYMKPIAPPPPPKKPSGPKEVPTYQTPTQSFTAKVVDPSKLSRHTHINMPTPPKSRPETPSPPAVHWVTAAQELSKLLIPSETRQVSSCRHEDLNEPKKRERHSSIGLQPLLPDQAGQRMQTRGRKAKQNVTDVGEPIDRRKTISDLPVHSEDSIAVSELSKSSVENDPTALKPNSRPPSRARPTSTACSDGLKVTKTRRASASKEGLSRTASNLPPVPPLSKSGNENAATGAKSSTDVDALTSEMGRITLKLPNPSADTSTKEEVAAVPKKPGRKPAASRAAKVPTAKSSNSKIPKSTPSTQGSIVPSELPYTGPTTDVKPEINTNPQSASIAGKSPSSATATTVPTLDGASERPLPLPESGPLSAFFTTYNSTGDTTANTTTVAAEEEPIGEIPSTDPLSKPNYSNNSDSNAPPDSQNLDFISCAPPHSAFSTTTSAKSNFHQEPLQWLPPNTNTPPKVSSKNGKANLPVFTAEGAIPFGPAPASNNENRVYEGGDAAHSGDGDGRPERENAFHEHDAGEGRSVWDVPVTPERA